MYSEAVGISENIQMSIDNLIYISVSENITSSDIMGDASYGIIAYDSASVNGALVDSVLSEENIEILIPELNLSIFESVSIEEYIEILDLIIELETYDQISIQENFQSKFDLYLIFVRDGIFVFEFLVTFNGEPISAFSLVSIEENIVLTFDKSIDQYDTITLVENFSGEVVPSELTPRLFRVTPRTKQFTVIKRFEFTITKRGNES